jgi:hypothetical protein
MKSLGAYVWGFVWEWGVQATVAGSRPFKSAKVVAAVLLVLVGIAWDSKIGISISPHSGPPGEIVDSPLQLGWWIVIGVIAVWLAVAFGKAWVGFKRLQVGKELEFNWPQQQVGRLTVVNHGLFDAECRAWAVAVADANGKRSVPELPLELEWMHNRHGASPKLSKGVLYKVDVLGAQGGESQDSKGNVTAWMCAFHFTGMHGIAIPIGTITSTDRNALWFAVAVGDFGHEKWFSIEPIDSPQRFKVTANAPPIPSPTSGTGFSVWDLPERLEQIVKGAIQRAMAGRPRRGP